MPAEKIIIDCDTGIDDALAIMCALSKPESVEVIAITCVKGNTTLNNVCRNTLRVLKVCDSLNIPVYKGAEHSFLALPIDASDAHGEDGMGDADNPEEVDMNLIQSENAVNALIRLVHEHPGEITLVALAPLTNVALAHRLDPSFGSELKKMVIMGGNIQGVGNTTPGAEFNFYCDAESAYVVLKEIHCPKTDISLELCHKHGLPWDWFDQWQSTDTEKGRFVKSITEKSAKKLKEEHAKSYVFYDALAMTTVVDSSIITKTQDLYAQVELGGQLTRGQMVCDWSSMLKQNSNVSVVQDVNDEKVRSLLEEMLE